MSMLPHFDFRLDKGTRSIQIIRPFSAPLKAVWKVWTTPELLDQWWGPKPWYVQTKTLVFEEGGHWLYAMISPEGEKQWNKMTYGAINPDQSFRALEVFCDEAGVPDPDLPQNEWTVSFTNAGVQTMVQCRLTFETLADLEQTLALNFEEGFTRGLEQLETLLLQ